MREDHELCTHFKYHKHKITFFLSAMRKYAEELRNAGYHVHYEELGENSGTFEDRLKTFMKAKHSSELEIFETEDKFFEKRILSLQDTSSIKLKVHSSPMFLTSRDKFQKYLNESKKPFMKSFYEWQRKRLKILIDNSGRPDGGQWSFDKENRKPLPQKHECPPIPLYELDMIDQEVIELVDSQFSDHPGKASDFWLPTDRKNAEKWARDFFDQRFESFGAYEDAFSQKYPFVYHSVLTPFLNTGLLTPKDCIQVALKTAKEEDIPINSTEGFVRQVVGWREFVRGIYQNYGEQQEASNHFNHQMEMTEVWYSGDTGIPPLDDVIAKVQKYGYAHHIERLMVVGSLMVLLEIKPREAHRWFMEMFIDSSDWVMGPNVYGMALFSDGGIFATKPYICGSNYYLKMSKYKKGDWCDGVDGLYWEFIRKHRKEFEKNPRMAMMTKILDKISVEKMDRISTAANKLRRVLVKQ